MRTADIIPRTVIYALQERSYRDPERAVVLSRTVHRMGSEEVGPDERAVTLRPGLGEPFRRMDYRGVGIGLPVITAHDSAITITDAELLAAAAALPERLDGPLPRVVGLGIRYHVVRPASIKSTWAEHLAAERQGEAAREAHLTQQRNLADDEIRARNAVHNLLHTYGADAVIGATAGEHGQSSTRVDAMDWRTLYDILSDLVTGVARFRSDEVTDDGRWHQVHQANWEA